MASTLPQLPLLPLLACSISLFLTSCGDSPQPRQNTRQSAKPLTFSELPAVLKANRINTGTRTSPFLNQFAENPLPWQPWDPEAFAAAKESSRPVFLFSGHATCSKSEIFRNEVLSNPAIQKLLRENFVCILIDADAQPGISVSIQEQLPQFGTRSTMPVAGFLTEDAMLFQTLDFNNQDAFTANYNQLLLESLANRWHEQKKDLTSSAALLKDKFHEVIQTIPPATTATTLDQLTNSILSEIQTSYDPNTGAFASYGTLYPRPLTIRLLLTLANQLPENDPRAATALDMATHSLSSLATGAIYDPIDGAFFRNSIGLGWDIPGSDKSTSQQALLLQAYLDATVITGNQEFKSIAQRLTQYLINQCRHENGLFITSNGAFDPDPNIQLPRYYLWKAEEIEQALSNEQWQSVRQLYGIIPSGNLPPTLAAGRATQHLNLLKPRQDIPTTAKTLDIPEATFRQHLNSAHQTLLTIRNNRPNKVVNDLISPAVNGLVVSALCHAATVLDDPSLLKIATDTVRHLEEIRAAVTSLPGAYQNNPAQHFTPSHYDYVLWIQALLDVAEATGDNTWNTNAIQLHDEAQKLFWQETSQLFTAFIANNPDHGTRWFIFSDTGYPSHIATAADYMMRMANLPDMASLRPIARNFLLRSDSNARPRNAHSLLLHRLRWLPQDS